MNKDPMSLLSRMKELGCFRSWERKAEQAVRVLRGESQAVRRLMTDAAEENARDNLAQRLTILSAHAVILELQEHLHAMGLPKVLLLTQWDTEDVTQAMKRTAEDAVVPRNIETKSPLIKEYENTIITLFVKNLSRMFSRLEADREIISHRLLGGREFSRVTALNLGSGDTHRHGQTVARVETDAGTFYYKPHDCGLDAFYAELVEKFFPDCLAAAQVAEGEGYAFVSELVRTPLKCQEDADKYFFNFGMMLSLFHGMGSRDMHAENVMACGVKPAVVDVETLLSPKSSYDSGDSISRCLQDSVLGTLVLPTRIHKMGFVSALHRQNLANGCSLPFFNGEEIDVQGREEIFIRGFREGYRRMMEMQKEIAPLILRHKDSAVRIVLHNTAYYYLVRRDLYQAEFMASEETQAKVLEKLRIPMRDKKDEPSEKIFRYEKECLKRGDIPYYCVGLFDKALTGEDPTEILQEGYFNNSPYHYMLERLANLSEAEALFEEDLLHDVLSAVPHDENTARTKFSLPAEGLSVLEMRRMAEKIWNTALKRRIRRPDGLIMWQERALIIESMFPVSLVVNWEDMAHSAFMATEAGFSGASETATHAYQGLCRFVNELERDDLRRLSAAGLFSGSGGFVSACASLSRASVSGVDSLLTRFLTQFLRRGVSTVKKIGVGYGLAGLLLALAEAYRDDRLRSDEMRLLMEQTAAELLTRDWPKDGGGTEGLSGIGAALAKAYACLGDERLADEALRAWEAVKQGYQSDRHGWIRSTERIPWLAPRAPWSAGIAWYAMETIDALVGKKGAEAAEEVLHLALDSLCREDSLLLRDSLFEGNAMSVLCLTRASRHLGEQSYLSRAAMVLAAMEKRREEAGEFRITGQGVRSFFDISFYMGTMGIAHAALCCMNEHNADGGMAK